MRRCLLLVVCLAGTVLASTAQVWVPAPKPVLAQERVFILGDDLAPWEQGGPPGSTEALRLRVSGRRAVIDTGNAPDGDVEFAHRAGWISPTYFDGDTNIAARVLVSPGRISSPNSFSVGVDLLRAQLAGTVNGDHSVAFERKPTTFQPVMPAFGIIVQLDFGRLVGIERVRFYPRDTVVPSARYPFAAQFLRGYELWVNEEIPTPTSGTPDRLIAREPDNSEPVVEIDVPPQYVRLIKLRSLSQSPFEVDEIEVYGSGYLDEAVYYSDLIDLGDRATIGPVFWREQVVGRAEFSDLRVRVRTGDDTMPLVFFERSLFLGEPPVEVSAADYWALDPTSRSGIGEDRVGWSAWKSVRNGELITARNPRRYIQFEIRFRGRLQDTRQLDRIQFGYLRPPLADTLWAEVFPRRAQPEEPASFRYAVRLRRNAGILGFDQLEVDTTVPVAGVRNVTVDGEAIDFDVLPSAPEILHLAFPLILEDEALLEFTFDLPVFRFGTTFSARAINSRVPAIAQVVEPGDATDFGPGDFPDLSGLFVSIPERQIGKLVGRISLSAAVLTPNGDGINDELQVLFNLLQLVDTAPVLFEVYDLSQRRVSRLDLGERGLGPAAFVWDGRGEDGSLLAPGNYMWLLRVRADAFEERHTGRIAVAY